MSNHQFQIIDITDNLSPIKTFQADPLDVLCMNQDDPLNIEKYARDTNRLKRQKSIASGIYLSVIILLVFVSSLLLFNQNTKFKNEKQQPEQETQQIQTLIQEDSFHDSPVSDTAIYNLAKMVGAYYPEIIVAQAQLESGFGASNLGKNANNLYGMKKCSRGANSRPSTQIPNKSHGQFAVYHNWQLSTVDRVLWDHSVIKVKPETRQEYIQRFIGIYAPGNTRYAGILENTASNWLKNNKQLCQR